MIQTNLTTSGPKNAYFLDIGPNLVQIAKFDKRKRLENLSSLCNIWWRLPDSNWGPADYDSDALTN